MTTHIYTGGNRYELFIVMFGSDDTFTQNKVYFITKTLKSTYFSIFSVFFIILLLFKHYNFVRTCLCLISLSNTNLFFRIILYIHLV